MEGGDAGANPAGAAENGVAVAETVIPLSGQHSIPKVEIPRSSDVATRTGARKSMQAPVQFK